MKNLLEKGKVRLEPADMLVCDDRKFVMIRIADLYKEFDYCLRCKDISDAVVKKTDDGFDYIELTYMPLCSLCGNLRQDQKEVHFLCPETVGKVDPSTYKLIIYMSNESFEEVKSILRPWLGDVPVIEGE